MSEMSAIGTGWQLEADVHEETALGFYDCHGLDVDTNNLVIATISIELGERRITLTFITGKWQPARREQSPKDQQLTSVQLFYGLDIEKGRM